MTLCPCGSLQKYAHCCETFIAEKKIPQTSEQLMRSRYTAFCLENWAYLKNTMVGKALSQFRPEKNTCTWLRLEIKTASLASTNAGTVEFIAYYLKNKLLYAVHEKSEFQRIHGKWFYSEGIHYPSIANQRIAQNAPCPCLSLKKFKNCHGA